MSKLEKNLITPQSILIEQTALDMACCFYEAGRNSGMTSKYKTPQAFAKRYVERFIPMAVSKLLDMLGNQSTPEEFKELIYSAVMERTNDKELSNIGIDAFKNDTPFLPDKPVIYDKRTLESVLDPKLMFEERQKNG